MSEMIRQEGRTFLASFLAGGILVWLYQILACFRKLLHTKMWVVNIEDFLYWSVAGLVIFAAVFYENNGEVRCYAAAAVLAGAWSQWGVLFFLHRICIKLLKKFKNRGRMT